MVGTIFGIPLSQRVDLNGLPAVGWLIYLYQANTSTPVNSYQDTGLTVLNPWPLPADANGTIGTFWLADGSYRIRGTSADGSLVYFDLPNVLALGASTGAPPPSGVDPNAIAQTGDVIWSLIQGTRTGWVRCNGKTIGPATSGATERANADTNPLFEFLWNNFTNVVCPVGGGRGGSAHSDWLSGTKAIGTPDLRGSGIVGLDDMGSTAAGRITSDNVINTPGGSQLVAATLMGGSFNLLSHDQMPQHAHSVYLTDPGHAHTTSGLNLSNGGGGTSGGGSVIVGSGGNFLSINSNTTGIVVGSSPGAGDNSTAAAGGIAPINNLPLMTTGTFFIRL